MGSIKLKSVEFNWQSRSMQYHSVYIQLTASVIFSFSSLSIFWVCSSTLGAPSKATRTILMLSVLPCKQKINMETLKNDWSLLCASKYLRRKSKQFPDCRTTSFGGEQTNTTLHCSSRPKCHHRLILKTHRTHYVGESLFRAQVKQVARKDLNHEPTRKKWINTNKYKQLKTLPACTGNLQEHAKQPMSH